VFFICVFFIYRAPTLTDDPRPGVDSTTHTACAHHIAGQDCKFCNIRLISVCSALEPDEWASLERLASDVAFAEKIALIREGDDSIWVYNVTSGIARLVRTLSDGRRQVFGFAMPGDFLGLSLDSEWSFSVETVTELTCCRFSRSGFRAFMDQKPHLLRKMHEFATHELSLARDHMMLLGRLTAEEKIAAFIWRMRQRWARVEGHTKFNVPLPMSRQDIADYLGLTIETVSRTINHLQRDRRLVIVPDGIRILVPDFFEHISSN